MTTVPVAMAAMTTITVVPVTTFITAMAAMLIVPVTAAVAVPAMMPVAGQRRTGHTQ
jgi:hypothetical protein